MCGFDGFDFIQVPSLDDFEKGLVDLDLVYFHFVVLSDCSKE